MRVPIASTLGIEEFVGGEITIPVSQLVNGVFLRRSDDVAYITQRPSIDISEDASAEVADERGRGVFYWNANSAKYFVNNDTVYKGDYSAPLGVTMSAGTERVHFYEVGDYLVIIDPENSEGWYIAVGASTTLVQLTNGTHGFPATPLARGGAVLNGTLYVMDKGGTIYGSDIEDITNWSALNFINAEVEKDGGVALAKHLNHVTAFGNRTIEFFYDASNPTGSPLSVRQDVSHQIGAVDHPTHWGDQNVLFFVGQTAAGGLAVYMLDGFMPKKVSTSDLDAFLTSAVYTDSKKLVGSGFSTGSGVFYILTVYHVIDDVVSLETLVYNPVTNTWTPWELMHAGIDDFPVADWTVATSSRIGEGILANGDLVTVGDDFSPRDSVNAIDGVFEAGTFEAGVFTGESPGYGTEISMEIVAGDSDYGTPNRKAMSSLRTVGPVTKNSQSLTVQWSDESNDDYNAGRTIDTSIPGRKLNRLGSFRRRNFKFTYAGSEKIEIEGFEADIQARAH